jgi:two-component system, NtrC family, response regulator AtoC
MGTANYQTILLGEDDPEVRNYLETALKCQGYKVEVAQDGDEVLACLQANDGPISAILLDIIMPRRDGFEALKEIRRYNKEIPVIIMSGASSSLNIVEAMKCGASDFVPKPVNPADLRKVLKTALAPKTVERSCPPEPGVPAGKQAFLSAAPSMRELQNLVGQIAWSDAPVLIQGETGAGKEIFARELHAHSQRAKKTFMKLNCAALPSELVESELFGYERGAFTGAFQKKLGIFELANGGTLLLDEIGDMDFKLQAKLLQVLQDQEFQRLGGKDTISVNVRILAATHKNLNDAIAQNTFREDLYHRLNVIGFRIPPLRERTQDIISLAEFFVNKHSPPGSSPVTLPESIKELLLAYSWPGNIRELENVIRQFLVFRDVGMFSRDLRHRIQTKSAGSEPLVPFKPDPEWKSSAPTIPMIVDPSDPHCAASVLQDVAKAKQDAERTAILSALKSARWNRKQAAQMLNIDYKAFLYKMKKLSIKKEHTTTPAVDFFQVSAGSAGKLHLTES